MAKGDEMYMENLLKEIDKTHGTGYSIIWRDYQIRKKRITQLSGKEFVEELINTVMVLHQLYVITDILYSKGWISDTEYNTVNKILDTERRWLKELLCGRLGCG